jgi:choline dehydrogenase
MNTFDVIVVGSGSAGGVVAGRLTEDPSLRVLLLEAGGKPQHPLLQVPVAWHAAAMQDRFTWGYASEPEAATGNRTMEQPRGRMLGGTSSINGMMYSRGNRGDYDSWAAAGLSGWGYDDVLPYFRRSETNWRGETTYHGGDGPLCVTKNPAHPEIYPAMIEAARALGYTELADFHGASQEGFGIPDFTTRGGHRESTYTAFLKPARARPNLTIETGALATRLRIQGTRVTGLDYMLGGQTRQASAGEVIVCAGAFNSPKLLLLSGIGPEDELATVGVAPQHDLPMVGKNLQDHPLVAAAYRAARPFGFERMLRADQLALASLRWGLLSDGPLADAPLSVQGYIRTETDSDRPDTQFQVSHVSFMARPWFPGWRAGAGDQFTAAAMQLRPDARGSVTLRSADPVAAPQIRLGMLETERDRNQAREMLRFIRRFFATEPVAGLVIDEIFPGLDIQNDEALDSFIASTIQTGQHPTSSCAMGTDPATSVVDANLQVHGLQGLRVADTSIMPTIVSGNTSAPAMMIGEKAADLVLGRSMANPRELALS